MMGYPDNKFYPNSTELPTTTFIFYKTFAYFNYISELCNEKYKGDK